MDKGTQHHSVEIIIHADPELTHKVFLSRVWWGGGFPWYLPVPSSGVVQEQKDKSGKGGIRQVPGFIQEEILDAKLGEYVEYTLKRKMFMPISYHRGRVQFYSAGPQCTRVVWEVSYTPFPLVGNAGMKMFMSTFALFFLPALKQEAEKQSKYVPRSGGGGGFFSLLLKLLMLAYCAFMVSRALRIPTKPMEPGTEYVEATNKFRLETDYLSQALHDDVFLIIGGTGFTGSAIVDDLRNRGVRGIRVMGRKMPANPEYPYPNNGRYPIPGVEYHRADLTDKAALLKAMTGATVVIHTAVSYGSPSFGSVRGGEATERINIGGMKNIYETARASGTVKQIIYTSSCDTVFSGRDLWRANETHPYLAAFGLKHTHAEGELAVGDNYARTKILAEKYILEQDGKHGIRTASLRPNGIFGPGEFSAFKKAIDPAFVLGFFPFYFDEKQETDWTCVYNLVYAHVLASYKLKTAPEQVGGKAYFITDDEITNNAATMIFKPAIEAGAGPARLWVKIPAWILPHIGHALEVVENFVFEKFAYSMPLGLTRKEALKTITSHTHDNSRARKDLGYKPLMTTGQCQAYTAEEISRRYGWKK